MDDIKFHLEMFQVNISPSLHSTSSLDLDVKSPLATEVFNMARYHIPNRFNQSNSGVLSENKSFKVATEGAEDYCSQYGLPGHDHALS